MNVYALYFCHVHLPNLSLTVCLSHINRKTQYENPVVEARRQKLLEQHQQPQPPEGERYIRGSFPALARHHFFLFFMSVSVTSFLSVYYFPGLRPGLFLFLKCAETADFSPRDIKKIPKIRVTVC